MRFIKLVLILVITVAIGLGTAPQVSAVGGGTLDSPASTDCERVQNAIDNNNGVIIPYREGAGIYPIYVESDEDAVQFTANCGIETTTPAYCQAGFQGPVEPDQQAECDRLNAGSNEDLTENCTNILNIGCGGVGAIWQILNLVLNIMTAGVGVLGVIGLVISGIQYMTARDREEQVQKAKSRIFNVVIGLVIWGLMWLLLQWLLPGGLLGNTQ